MKFISGLRNCHLPELYSLVLADRVSDTCGMRRVFYAASGLGDQACNMQLWDGPDFRLKPHNHRQDITLTPLFGDVIQVGLKLSDTYGDFFVYKYKYEPALGSDAFTLERMEYSKAKLVLEPLVKPVHMHWSDLHTIVAHPGSAWLVEEGQLAPAGMQRLYSTSHRLVLSNDGLYIPMTEYELRTVESLINVGMDKKERSANVNA